MLEETLVLAWRLQRIASGSRLPTHGEAEAAGMCDDGRVSQLSMTICQLTNYE